MTTREGFEELLKMHCILEDPDRITEVVSDFLYAKADELKRTEPYAVNTIRSYEDAARTVLYMLED